MSATNDYQDYWINPRLKVAALWTAMLVIFAYVDLFGLFRSDVRADIEAGKIAGFAIGQGYLLGVTIYVLVPSLMVFLSLALRVRVVRMVNIALAVLYAITVLGSAVGEWNYFILGSLAEAVLLAGVVYYAWTWPKATEALGRPADESESRTRKHSTAGLRR